jgi:hypothetical protein
VSCRIFGLSDCTGRCLCDAANDATLSCDDGSALGLNSCVIDEIVTCDSDARLKTNVKTLKNSLDIIMQLNPVEFDWKEITPQYDWFVEKGITHSIGFIAQEVKQLVPEIVILKNNGYYTIDYPKINALLVEGIKEQQVFIDEVENDIIYLEKYFNI